MPSAFYHLSAIHKRGNFGIICNDWLLLGYLCVCLHKCWQENRMKRVLDFLTGFSPDLGSFHVVDSYVVSKCSKLPRCFHSIFIISDLCDTRSSRDNYLFSRFTFRPFAFSYLTYFYGFRIVLRPECPRVYAPSLATFLLQRVGGFCFRIFTLDLLHLLRGCSWLWALWKLVFFL